MWEEKHLQKLHTVHLNLYTADTRRWHTAPWPGRKMTRNRQAG